MKKFCIDKEPMSSENLETAIKNEKTENKIEEIQKDEKKVEEPVEMPSKKKQSPFLASEATNISKEEDKKPADSADDALRKLSTFNAIGKLYFLSTKTSKLETRGEGEFFIFKDKSEMYRLMMIRDQFKLKGCNHYILENCPLTKPNQTPNSWIWTAIKDQSDAEKKEDKTVYFATFKTAETAKEFEEKYNEAQKENSKVLESKKKPEGDKTKEL